MVCSFTDPDKIKEWIELCKLMKEMDTLVYMCFNPNQLSIQIKHSTNRSILDMTFPNTWFSFYDWKDAELYVSTDSLFTIFSRYSGEKIISMESESKYLLIKCFHDKQNKYYSIPLHFRPQKSVCIDCEPGITFTIDTSFLYTLCNELYSFDDLVLFSRKNEFFHMTAQQERKMMIEIQPNMIDIPESSNYESKFELFYLLLFLKCSELYPVLTVRLSNLLCFSVEKEYSLCYYVCRTKS